MKYLILQFIFILIIFYVKTEQVLEHGDTLKSSDGYIIFNSKNTENNKEMKFKIKAYFFNLDFVQYYYIDNLEDLDIYEINLFKSEFNLNKTEDENELEINYFTIIKNSSEYKSTEGKYLVIFYYTSDSKAEIINIKESNEEKKEEDYTEYWIILIVGVVVCIFIYCFYRKKKDKNNNNNNEIKSINDIHNNENNMVVPYINPLTLEIMKQNQEQRAELEKTKKKNELLEQIELLRKELEKRKEQKIKEQQYLQIQRLERLLGKIKRVKAQNKDIFDYIIPEEKDIAPDDIIYLKFQSMDQKIKCIIFCREDEVFNNVVNKVFEKKPEFKEYNNYFFLVNGNQIKSYKTLKENNIKDGNAIILNNPNEQDD